MRQREEWVDITRGIAILLVVIGHVINSYIVADMFLTYDRYLKYTYFTIYSFHMPLFFMISGYLYVNVTVDKFGDYKKLLLKKVVALGVPYIIFSIVQGSVQILFSSVTHNHIAASSLLNIGLHPILQFWFLYALLLIFIAIPLMELIFKNFILVAAILIIFKIVSLVFVTNIFPIDTFLANAVYFYSGKLLFKYKRVILHNKLLLVTASILYAILNILCYFILSNIYKIHIINGITDICLAVLGSMLIIYLVTYPIEKTILIKNILNVLGRYSFEIYLLHIMFSYGVKTILIKLEINSLFVHLLLGTAAGVIIPIIIGYTDRNIPLLYYVFYPHKVLKWREDIK